LSNPYRNIPVFESEPYIPEEEEAGDLSLGIRRDFPSRKLPLGATHFMEGVRFSGRMLQKDFGDESLGGTIVGTILALKDHGFINADKETKEFLHLLARRVDPTRLDMYFWTGSSWNFENSIEAEVPNRKIRSISALGVFLIGTIDDHIVVRLEDVIVPRTQEDSFEPGVIEDASTTREATLTLPPGTVEEFDVRYRILLEMTSADRVRVNVRARRIDGSDTTVERSENFESFGETIDEVTSLLLPEGSGDKIALDVSHVDVEGGNPSTFESRETADFTDEGALTIPRYQTTKVEAPPAFGNEYTFLFTPQWTGEGFPTENPTVNLYARPGGTGPWIIVDSYTATFSGQSRTIVRSGLGAGTLFGINFINNDPEDPDWILDMGSDRRVIWEEEIPPEDPGFSFRVTPINVNYRFNEEIAGAVLEKLTSGPKAFWLDSFADRIIALHDDGDSQIFSYTASGTFDNWSGFGSDSIALVDTRVEPVDSLQCTAPVNDEILAVFRSRSIMRAFRTGQGFPAIGVRHWHEGVGTRSPFSVKTTPGGVLFLASDKMVRLLTAGGILEVGVPVWKEILEKDFPLRDVDAAYDLNHQEYYLGVGGDTIYIFDLGRFLQTEEIVWRRRNQEFTRLAESTVPVPD
jgi:hypothetical protein